MIKYHIRRSIAKRLFAIIAFVGFLCSFAIASLSYESHTYRTILAADHQQSIPQQQDEQLLLAYDPNCPELDQR